MFAHSIKLMRCYFLNIYGENILVGNIFGTVFRWNPPPALPRRLTKNINNQNLKNTDYK